MNWNGCAGDTPAELKKPKAGRWGVLQTPRLRTQGTLLRRRVLIQDEVWDEQRLGVAPPPCSRRRVEVSAH